jgi:hypothetical protein
MNAVATIILTAAALYVATGTVVGLAFVVRGVSQVLPQPAGVTLGARVLLFPGAAALWPFVLARWRKLRR